MKRYANKIGTKWGCNPRTFFSLIPLSRVKDFESFRETRFLIGFIKNERKERINNLYASKVHFIILTRNPRVSDGYLNDDLSLNQNIKRDKCMDNLYDPKAFSITFAQNPRISYGCLNTRLIIGSHGVH